MRCLCVVLLASVTYAACAQQATLENKKKLRDSDAVSIDAFPRVVAGGGVTDGVAAKVNASLTRFDAEVLRDAKECGEAQSKLTRGEDAGSYSREVAVTMTGPRYLSYTADDGYDCGGVHPDDSSFVLVYDLATGSPVNWAALLPPVARGEVFRRPHRLSIGVIHWEEMRRRARAMAMEHDGDADCGQAYDNMPEFVSFNVYLSAREHAIALSPNLTPHIDAALCKAVVLIKPDEAKRLGIAQPLIDAITAAR